LRVRRNADRIAFPPSLTTTAILARSRLQV
jgi:hypothetical protein